MSYEFSTPRKWSHANKYNIDYCSNCKKSRSGTILFTDTANGISANSANEALSILKKRLNSVDSDNNIQYIGYSIDYKYYYDDDAVLPDKFFPFIVDGHLHDNYTRLEYYNWALKNAPHCGAVNFLKSITSTSSKYVFPLYDSSVYYDEIDILIYENCFILLNCSYVDFAWTNLFYIYWLKPEYKRFDGRIKTDCCLLSMCKPTIYVKG